MYPFTGEHTYVRNAWYVAATLEELRAGPVERQIMDQPVAMFLTASGKPAAMHGVCPHRYYPLAQGRVVDDSLQCNYHGFRFDGITGACVQIPSQSEVPKAYRQRVYPAVAHGPFVWIWPGDVDQADPSLLPPLDHAGLSENWTVLVGKPVLAEGRAQLLVENLLDLTHVDFLHAQSLDSGELLASPVEVREDGWGVHVSRGGTAPWVAGFYDLLYGPQHRFEGQHDYVGSTWYFSPAYLRTGVEITRIDGCDTVDPAVFGRFCFQHFLTPATQGSVHYFSAQTRNYRPGDPAFDEHMITLDLEVRMQDVVAVRLVEQNLSRPWTMVPELLAKSDAGAIRVRRKIQALIDAEQRREPAAA